MGTTMGITWTFAGQDFEHELQQLLFLKEKYHAFFIFDNMSTINRVLCHQQPQTGDTVM